ncbi:transposase [Planktomarina sp.]|uniref:transposase n=1 Tax=Planktomarina TaxID=1284657 RepID=UPI0035302076
MKQCNVRQFFKQVPDDATCLEHLFNTLFGQGHECPKCERACATGQSVLALWLGYAEVF